MRIFTLESLREFFFFSSLPSQVWLLLRKIFDEKHDVLLPENLSSSLRHTETLKASKEISINFHFFLVQCSTMFDVTHERNKAGDAMIGLGKNMFSIYL